MNGRSMTRTALMSTAWAMKLYAALARVWPLSLLVYAWVLFGTPFVLTGEELTTRDGTSVWSCTYRALWVTHEHTQWATCPVIILVRS